MNKKEQAANDYSNGMKYKDISSKYGIPVNTLKSWRNREGWQRGAPTTKKLHPKTKRDAPKVAPKIIDELEANGELNDKQKLFCLFYLQRFNATWAYKQAYKASYDVANVNGPRLMVNASIRKQLTELKKQQSADLYFDINDIIHEFRQQSKSDIRDVVDFETVKHMSWVKIPDDNGQYEDSYGNYRLEPKIDPDTGKQAFYFENRVKLHNSDEIDTSNIKSIRIDKGQAVVEMYDKQKALDSLMKYADTYTSQHEETNGVQIVDDIEGDEKDGKESKPEK